MSAVFVPGKENNIYRHNTERVRACMYEALEDFQLVVFFSYHVTISHTRP